MSRYRGRMRTVQGRPRQLETGLSIEELLTWMASIPDDEAAYQKNYWKLVDAAHDLVAFSESAVQPIIDLLLSSENPRLRMKLMRILRQIGDPRAIEPLWSQLRNSPDAYFERGVLLILSSFKPPGLFEMLVPLLNHEDSHLSNGALIALGRLGDPRAVELLMPLIGHQRKFVSQSAISALGKLGDRRAVPLLAARLDEFFLREPYVLIEALGNLGGEEAIRALERIVNMPETSLDRTGLDVHLQCRALTAVAAIDDPLAKGVVEAALHHPKPGVRRRARHLLGIKTRQT